MIPEGVLYITGRQTTAIEAILDRLAYHWDADEIHRQQPHIGLDQIYSALAYHDDHQAEMDREIEEQSHQVNQIQTSLGESLVRLKLKAMGRRP